jgi:uncharacterized membrane protein
MRTNLKFLGGLAAGLGAMYWLDPRIGGRRRALVRDSAVRIRRKLERGVEATLRDITNRIQGTVASLRSRLGDDSATERVLHERVRSRLGRWVSHPHAIGVTVEFGGRVILYGPVLADERAKLVNALSSVRGVMEIDDRLEAYDADTARSVPALQGGQPPPGERPEWLQERWSPAFQLAAVLTGGALLGYALRRRDVLAPIMGIVGGGLLVRALSNRGTRDVLEPITGQPTVGIHRRLEIRVPPDEIYEIWSRFENVPRFLPNVKEVRVLSNVRSRWLVEGPLGIPATWDMRITRKVPDRLLAWESEPDSPLPNSGVVRFEPTGESTIIDLRLSYTPPTGALGDAAAQFFGSDLDSQVDEALGRLKTFLEMGHASRVATQVSERVGARNGG